MELGLGLTKLIPVFIYVVGVVVVLLTLFYKIEIGIFFLVPLLPQQSLIDRIQNWPMGKDFVDILLLAIILKWIFNKSAGGEGGWTKTKFNIPIILLILWTYAELWRGSFYLGTGAPTLRDPRFVIWKNFMIMPILYLAVLNNVKNPKAIKILVVLMAASTLLMGLHFRNSVRHTDMSHYHHDMRQTGTFSYLSPNAVAVFFAQYSALFLSLYLLDKHKWRKWLYLGAAIFGFYAVMFSFSRGGYMAALMGIFFIGFFRNKKLLALMIFFLLTWKVWVPNAVIERIEMSSGDSSIQQRLDLWETGQQIIANNPVIGLGFATFSMKRIEEEISGKSRESFHNGYLQVSAELGFIGLFIFMYIYYLGLKAGYKVYKKSNSPFHRGLGFGLAACIVGALAGNIGGSYWHFINVSGFYWVVQALVVQVAIKLDEEEKNGGREQLEQAEFTEVKDLTPVTDL